MGPPTLCYKTLNLLHISKDKDYFVFCANRIVGSKSHGKPVGDDFYPAFSLVFKLTYRFITKPENSIYIYKFLDTTIECYNI